MIARMIAMSIAYSPVIAMAGVCIIAMLGGWTMSDKWTPGPWSYRPELHDDWGTVRAGNGLICRARDPNVWHESELAAHRENKTDPWEANARLISAAPDMAEALAELLKEVDKLGKLDSRGHSDEDVWIGDASGVVRVGSLRRARAALAKARGET